MHLLIKLLIVSLTIFWIGIPESKNIKNHTNESIIQSDTLISGFYIIDDNQGVKKIPKDSNESYLLESKTLINIQNIKKVKITSIKNSVFGKIRKRSGLLFIMDKDEENALKIASNTTVDKSLKIGLVINNELVLVFFLNNQINNNAFFIEIDTSKNKLKELKNLINNQIK